MSQSHSEVGSYRSAVLVWAVLAAASSGLGCSNDDSGVSRGGSNAAYDPNHPADPASPSPSYPSPSGAGGSSGSATGNTNISFSGTQDFGLFRARLDANQVPLAADFEAAGFFAEHHTKLPPPACGERICLQAMLGVMSSLSSDAACTMLQIGLNSPIVADPTLRPPLTLAVVVDISGSMLVDNKIGFVREGLGHLIDGLRDGDRVALLTYNQDVSIRFPMQEVSLKRTELRQIAQSLQAAGSTNFHDGLKAGYDQVRANYDTGRQNRVIMLSDGNPTIGITSNQAILDMSRAYNSDGIGLTTVGLGLDFNPALMNTLAKQADGNFYFLENSAAVSEVFTEEISYFTVPIAFDLQAELIGGNHYVFGRAYGSPFWIDGNNGGKVSVPSVFLAHRQSHDDQTPDGGRRGGGSALLVEMMPRLARDDGSGITSADVGVIRLTFREPGTNRIVTQEVVVGYPQAPWVTPEVGYFAAPDISIVEKSFVMLNIYTGLETACRTFHENRAGASEQIGRLRRLIAAVEDYNQEIADQDIAADLVLLRRLIDVLLRNGVTDPAAPPIPTNPWPRD